MSNLPPGVTEGMIPGNRPEDMAREAVDDALLDAVMDADTATMKILIKLVGAMVPVLQAERERIWAEAVTDERAAREMEKEGEGDG